MWQVFRNCCLRQRHISESRIYIRAIRESSSRSSDGSSQLSDILSSVASGKLDVEKALALCKGQQLEGIKPSYNRLQQESAGLAEMTEIVEGYARIDHGRMARTGLPEVVFGEGKSVEQIRAIMQTMHDEAPSYSVELSNLSESKGRPPVVGMATRVSEEVFTAISPSLPNMVYYQEARICALQYDAEALHTNGGRVFTYSDIESASCGQSQQEEEDLLNQSSSPWDVVVLCAGTSDLGVAEEAAVTSELFGLRVSRLYDVGVAGLHRLLQRMPTVRSAKVAICVAGMDGALPSVVGGLAKCPVIAVPTSVGYGAAFGGVAPLLTMLNACAPGVSVVNIDNGFGAAMCAVKILQSTMGTK